MRKMLKRIAAATIGKWQEEKKEDTAAAPEENYTLMFGHAQTETHPYQACFQEWADAVAEKTNGGLVIDLYPSNTLGSE